MTRTVAHIGEFGLISALKKYQNLSPRVVKGIGDDTAVIRAGKDKYLLFTTDMLAEGVHFRRGEDPRLVGRKALACSISDIAAMGGVPTEAVVSLGAAPRTPVKYVDGLYRGMYDLARRFGVGIVGGDTIAAGRLVLNVALLGEVRRKDLVLRGGARVGDRIFVTGPLGRSLASGKHLSFVPRVEQSQFLVRRFRPSAMIDISDGLAADLGHILEESGVGAVLDGAVIPRTRGASLEQALYGGEDFELLFTLPEAKAKRLLDWQIRTRAWFFFPVGKIVPQRGGLKILGPGGKARALQPGGYTHF